MFYIKVLLKLSYTAMPTMVERILRKDLNRFLLQYFPLMCSPTQYLVLEDLLLSLEGTETHQ